PITASAQDFAAWYQDVVLAGDMAEPAEIVKGCMVIKANGWAVWEGLQRELDTRFKATGHQNMYFPLLIPDSFLHKEAEHVEGFSPELAALSRPLIFWRLTKLTLGGAALGRKLLGADTEPVQIQQKRSLE